MSITYGIIPKIISGETVHAPVLQILNMKTMHDGKIRLMLFDGKTKYGYSIMASQLKTRVDSGEIHDNCLIQLDNYLVQKQSDKMAIIILNVTTIAADIATSTTSTDIKNIPNIATTTEIATPKSSKPMVMGNSNVATIPISLLNPYQNKWTIKGIVIKKDTIRTWNKPNSSGRLFNFIMMDSSCDIQITAFNEEIDRFHDLIEVGKTYLLSKGFVKVVDQKYKATKCDHSISLKAESEITQVTADVDIPKIQYKFEDINRIKDISPGATIDILAVVHEIKPVATIVTKTNKEVLKREIVLVDRSGCSINATLWAENVNVLDKVENAVLVISNATISDFGGRSLSISHNSVMRVNPDDVEGAQSLSGWYRNGGHSNQFDAQSTGGGGSFKSNKKATIAELTCSSEKGDYFMVEGASVLNIKRENIIYRACEKCNKKLMGEQDGLYNCQKCGETSAGFNYRLMLNINLADHTGNCWVTAFQESAEKMLGLKASEVGPMAESQDKEEIDRLILSVLHKEEICARVSVRNDTYNDETRLKIMLQDWQPINTSDGIASVLLQLS